MLIKQGHWKNALYLLKFQTTVFDGCYDVLMLSIDISSIATLNIHGVDCHCVAVVVSESKVINLFKKYWFDWKYSVIIDYYRKFYDVLKMNK